jgi:hypothetical protein
VKKPGEVGFMVIISMLRFEKGGELMIVDSINKRRTGGKKK